MGIRGRLPTDWVGQLRSCVLFLYVCLFFQGFFVMLLGQSWLFCIWDGIWRNGYVQNRRIMVFGSRVEDIGKSGWSIVPRFLLSCHCHRHGIY